MKKHKQRILIILASLLLILLIAYSYIYQGRKKDDSKKISVIVYGDNVQRWENFQQGVKQAAIDLNAEVSFPNIMEESSSTKQKEQMEREIKNKAQGLIIVAADSEGLTESVREAVKSVPVVMAETNVRAADDPVLEYISADNKKMGEALAADIMQESEKDVPVYIVLVNQQKDSVLERQNGLESCLRDNGYQVNYWQPGEGDIKLSLFINKMLGMHDPGIVAALDETTLESVIEGCERYISASKTAADSGSIQEDTDRQVPSVYGIGSTAKVVYYLDRGLIRGIVFQDEYHVGYTSMVRILKQVKEGQHPQEGIGDIEFYSADKEALHLPEYERLLYPIIQ